MHTIASHVRKIPYMLQEVENIKKLKHVSYNGTPMGFIPCRVVPNRISCITWPDTNSNVPKL